MKTSKHLNLRATRDCYHGFTLIELLVVMAIISLLAAMLMPILHSAMESARAAQCMSNQKQVGVVFHLYAGDHLGWLPYINPVKIGHTNSYGLNTRRYMWFLFYEPYLGNRLPESDFWVNSPFTGDRLPLLHILVKKFPVLSCPVKARYPRSTAYYWGKNMWDFMLVCEKGPQAYNNPLL